MMKVNIKQHTYNAQNRYLLREVKLVNQSPGICLEIPFSEKL